MFYFSWSPRAVLTALLNPAKYLINSKVISFIFHLIFYIYIYISIRLFNMKEMDVQQQIFFQVLILNVIQIVIVQNILIH
jgi:hypothetical protein